MPRFYFDLQDDDGLVIDDEGVELDVDAVQKEAAFTMPDAVREKLRGPPTTGNRSPSPRRHWTDHAFPSCY
jgi:hypothetical protein